MWSRVAVVLLSAASCHAGLLGAGTGEGSCAAAPFRAPAVKWPGGCPASAPCCSEYGYCQPQENWRAGVFRDCNGVSNGIALPPETINAENVAAAHGDTAAAHLLVVPAGAGAPVVAPVAPVATVGAAGAVGAVPAAGGAVYAAAPGVVGAVGAVGAGLAGYGAFTDAHGNYVAAPGSYAAAPAAYAAASSGLGALHGAYGAGYHGHVAVPAYTSG